MEVSIQPARDADAGCVLLGADVLKHRGIREDPREQAEGALFIIVYNVIATFIILKVISFITPLRMDEAILKVGDDAVHGETAYAIGTEGE